MSVIVGGTDTPRTGMARPRGPRTVLLAVLAFAVLGLVALPSSPAGDQTPTEPEPLADSGRWVPVGASELDPFGASRLGDSFLFVAGDAIARIDRSGNTQLMHSFEAGEHPQRITSNGDMAVVAGSIGEHAPVLWTSTDGLDWDEIRLPWNGSVLAVAIRPEGLVVLGLDSTRGREIAARQVDGGWAVAATDAPDSVLRSTGDGIVGRATLQDSSVGYLYSVDGLTWVPTGSQLSLHSGEVLTLHHEAGVAHARRPGSDAVILPPELPIVAYWTLEDRQWIQTPTAVWWSTDGRRWSPLPVDRFHGVQGGAPILLPFSDRALISVGGARGTPRAVYQWILGT